MNYAGGGLAELESMAMASWLPALRRYMVVTLIGHLVWELLQLPLYTLWTDATTGQIAFAVAHCTGADVLIALACLVAALLLAGNSAWPSEDFLRVSVITLLFGVAYTVYSEWLNVNVRGSWAYAPAMPTLPPLGTGLTPILQWLVIPGLALAATRRARRS